MCKSSALIQAVVSFTESSHAKASLWRRSRNWCFGLAVVLIALVAIAGLGLAVTTFLNSVSDAFVALAVKNCKSAINFC